jgi:hypothetical protein
MMLYRTPLEIDSYKISIVTKDPVNLFTENQRRTKERFRGYIRYLYFFISLK